MIRIARPSACVASTRERRISSRWSGVLMQSTLRPTKPDHASRTVELSAPISEAASIPNHVPPRPVATRGLRESTTTDQPNSSGASQMINPGNRSPGDETLPRLQFSDIGLTPPVLGSKDIVHTVSLL